MNNPIPPNASASSPATAPPPASPRSASAITQPASELASPVIGQSAKAALLALQQGRQAILQATVTKLEGIRILKEGQSITPEKPLLSNPQGTAQFDIQQQLLARLVSPSTHTGGEVLLRLASPVQLHQGMLLGLTKPSAESGQAPRSSSEATASPETSRLMDSRLQLQIERFLPARTLAHELARQILPRTGHQRLVDSLLQLHQVLDKTLQTTTSGTGQAQSSGSSLQPDLAPLKTLNRQLSQLLSLTDATHGAPKNGNTPTRNTPLASGLRNLIRSLMVAQGYDTPSASDFGTGSPSPRAPGLVQNCLECLVALLKPHIFRQDFSQPIRFEHLFAQAQSSSQPGNDPMLLPLLRQVLAHLQLAPLHSLQTPDQSGLILNLSIPFLWQQQPQQVELQLFREPDENSQAKSRQKRWLVQLTFDLNTLGKLYSRIAVTGEQAEAIFWAEEKASWQAIQEQLPRLTDTLQQLGISVGTLECFNGTPTFTKTTLATQFVDVHT